MAIVNFKNVINIDQNFAQAYSNIGQIYASLGNWLLWLLAPFVRDLGTFMLLAFFLVFFLVFLKFVLIYKPLK